MLPRRSVEVSLPQKGQHKFGLGEKGKQGREVTHRNLSGNLLSVFSRREFAEDSEEYPSKVRKLEGGVSLLLR
jgi:hypothetical protein